MCGRGASCKHARVDVCREVQWAPGRPVPLRSSAGLGSVRHSGVPCRCLVRRCHRQLHPMHHSPRVLSHQRAEVERRQDLPQGQDARGDSWQVAHQCKHQLGLPSGVWGSRSRKVSSRPAVADVPLKLTKTAACCLHRHLPSSASPAMAGGGHITCMRSSLASSPGRSSVSCATRHSTSGSVTSNCARESGHVCAASNRGGAGGMWPHVAAHQKATPLGATAPCTCHSHCPPAAAQARTDHLLRRNHLLRDPNEDQLALCR